MSDKLTNFFNKLSTSLPEFASKKNVAGLLVLGIAVLSIPIGVELVQTQQTLRSQAAAPTGCDAFKISKPAFTNTCASCLAKQRPGLIDAIKQQHPYAAQCDQQALMHLWCNGGGQIACTGKDPGGNTKGQEIARDGDTWGCTQGKNSYNTSPAATRQCIDTMSGVCFEECKQTIYDKNIGTCTAVAEGFPQQPLDPYTTYEFNFCRTHWTDSLPQEHTSFRRDSALMAVINPAAPVGRCGQFTMKVRLDSGGPGLHSLQLATGDTSLYEHPPGGQPLGQSNQPSSINNNAPFYTPRAVCTDIVYEVKGKETLLPEGQNKIGYNSCAYNIGGQQNDMGTDCALCLESKRPGLSGDILNLNFPLFRACSIRELANKWCSDVNPTACSQLKSQCGTVCGVSNPTISVTPTPGGSGGTLTPTITPTSAPTTLSAPQNLRSFCTTNNSAVIRWSRVTGAESYLVSIVDHKPGVRDIIRTKVVTDPTDLLVRPSVEIYTETGMTHEWTVKAVRGSINSTVSTGQRFGCS
jgi:hypothetical protein